MSFKFDSSNLIYIKNLSPLVTENDIRRTFQHCDEIIHIVFNTFGIANQRYCIIEFKSSAGVTNASLLNNETLYSIPMSISVVDPTSSVGTSPAPITPPSASTTQNNLLEAAMNSHIASIHARQEAVESAAAQAKLLAVKKMNEMGLMSYAEELNGDHLQKSNDESEQKLLERTIYVDNFGPTTTINDLKAVFGIIGTVEDIRVDYLGDDKTSRFCLIQFSNSILANTALKMDGFELGNHTLRITKSRSTVTYKEPDGVQFEFGGGNLPPVPVAYQQMHKIRMEEKMAMFREAGNKLLQKKLQGSSEPSQTPSQKSHQGDSKDPEKTSRKADSERNASYHSPSRSRSKRTSSYRRRRSISTSISRERRPYKRKNSSPELEPWWIKEGEKLREREFYKRNTYRRADTGRFNNYHRDRFRRSRYSPSPPRRSYSTESNRSSVSRRRNRGRGQLRSPPPSRRKRGHRYSSASSTSSRKPSVSPSNSSHISRENHIVERSPNSQSPPPQNSKNLENTEDKHEENEKEQLQDAGYKDDKEGGIIEEEIPSRHHKKHKKSSSEHKKKHKRGSNEDSHHKSHRRGRKEESSNKHRSHHRSKRNKERSPSSPSD